MSTLEDLRDRIQGPLPNIQGEDVIVRQAFGKHFLDLVDPCNHVRQLIWTNAELAHGRDDCIPVDTVGLTPGRAASLYKIATPLLLHGCGAIINLDADIKIRARPGQLRTAFLMSVHFGFVASWHPIHTWILDVEEEAKCDALMRRGLNVLMPLYMCGAIGRCERRISQIWLKEFVANGLREQPALTLAIHRAGVAPLGLGEGWLSYAAACHEALFWHEPQANPIPSFFYPKIRALMGQRDTMQGLHGDALARWVCLETQRLMTDALARLEASDGVCG